MNSTFIEDATKRIGDEIRASTRIEWVATEDKRRFVGVVKMDRDRIVRAITEGTATIKRLDEIRARE